MATGYRINELPDVQPPYSALANAYFEAEAPTGAAGAYTNQRLRGDKLTEWLKTAVGPDNRAPNQRPNLRFIVRTLAERDALDPLKMCLGATCQVQEPKVQEYVLLYTPHSATTFYTHKTGDFDASLTDAAWYKADAPAVGVPAYPQFAADYVFAVNDLVRAYVSGNTTELFFAANAATVLPAPSNAAGDANWRLVAQADLPPASPGLSTLWQAGGAPYAANQLVHNSAGQQFRTLQANASHATEPTLPLSAGLAAYYRFIGWDETRVATLESALLSRFNMRGVWATNTTYAQYDAVTYNGATYYCNGAAFTSGTAFDPKNWVGFGAGLYTTIDYLNEIRIGVDPGGTNPGSRAGSYSVDGVGGKSYVCNGHTVEAFDPSNVAAGALLFGRVFAFRAIGMAASTIVSNVTTTPFTFGVTQATSIVLQPGEYVWLRARDSTGYDIVIDGRKTAGTAGPQATNSTLGTVRGGGTGNVNINPDGSMSAPSSGSSTTTLVLDSADPNRVSKGIPVTAVFQISAETLDVNAASIAYQLDTNTRTTRVYGSPDQTRAQINTQLAALTATQMSEGAKLYVKTVPTVTANPSTIILTLQ